MRFEGGIRDHLKRQPPGRQVLFLLVPDLEGEGGAFAQELLRYSVGACTPQASRKASSHETERKKGKLAGEQAVRKQTGKSRASGVITPSINERENRHACEASSQVGAKQSQAASATPAGRRWRRMMHRQAVQSIALALKDKS